MQKRFTTRSCIGYVCCSLSDVEYLSYRDYCVTFSFYSKIVLRYWCVKVRKGKNGKEHHQRIPLKDVDFVRSYFNGSEDYVFRKAELDNLINLHRLRGALARRMYQEYLHRIETEPDYADQLREELKARFKNRKVKSKWKDHEVQGVYRVRGANRKRAEALGLPIEYSRLAVMAVSVFHLSHWRTNVAVTNYLLAL